MYNKMRRDKVRNGDSSIKVRCKKIAYDGLVMCNLQMHQFDEWSLST